MFISPAFEELTEPSASTASGQQRSLPSSVHDPPPMDEYESSGSGSNRAGGSPDLEVFQRELARQLAGVDQQTFQRVKQAIQTVVAQRQDATDLQSIIQSARERSQQAMHSSATGRPEDSKGAFSTIADAVTSAGNAIGQLSSQILGGGELQEEVADEDATMRAEEAVQPLRDWQQGRQPSQGSTFSSQEQQGSQPHQGSTYTRQEQQSAPTGYFSRESKSAQDSGPGNEYSASQHTSEAGKWTTSGSGNEGAHSYKRQDSDTARRAHENQNDQGALQNTGGNNQNPVEVFSRSSIRQNESSSLHGDAQNVGLEEAMRRARRPF